MLVALLLSSRGALPADDTKGGFVGCKTSIAYFPEHKVALCTVPKGSSSSWREFARRVYAVDQGKPSPANWCGRNRPDFNGCLLDQPGAPPGVKSFDQLKNLVEKEHYTPAVFLRDPIERTLSAYTGTGHAHGPDPTKTTFAQFVDQLEQGVYNGNQHMAPQMKLCDYGRWRNESGIPWKFASSTPRHHQNNEETTRRAQDFVSNIFGSEMMASIKKNWTQCTGFTEDEFYSYTSQAKAEGDLVTPELRKRIEALYSEDVEAYAESERQYSSAETGRRLKASSEPKALVP
jgi:hypothetical protein